MPRLLAPVLTAVLAASVLAACSSGDDPESGSPGATASSASPYLPVPDGVSLTPQGTQLSVGDPATVAYQPDQGDEVGVLDIKVTRLEKTTMDKAFSGWQLDAETRKSTPYFVHATIKNVGDSDLGGKPVPLYIVDGTNTLIQATSFKSTYQPCPSTPFPDKFRHGDKTDVCQVYLVPNHGKLVAASFRPEESFDPIIWTGQVERPKPAVPAKKDAGSEKKSKNG